MTSEDKLTMLKYLATTFGRDDVQCILSCMVGLVVAAETDDGDQQWYIDQLTVLATIANDIADKGVKRVIAQMILEGNMDDESD